VNIDLHKKAILSSGEYHFFTSKTTGTLQTFIVPGGHE